MTLGITNGLTLGITKGGGEMPLLNSTYTTPVQNVLNATQTTAIENNIPASNLLCFFTSFDADIDNSNIEINGTLPKLVIGGLAPRSGSVTNNLIPNATDSKRPAISIDNSLAPTSGDNNDQYWQASVDLGSITNRSKTFYFTFAFTNANSTPNAQANDGMFSIQFYETGTPNDDYFAAVIRQDFNMNILRRGTWGAENNNINQLPRFIAWPYYITIAFIIDANGHVSYSIAGQTPIANAVGPITLRTANMGLSFGRLTSSSDFNNNVLLKHCAVYDAAHDAATVASTCATLQSDLPSSLADTTPLLIGIGDSITAGFNADYGLTWPHYAAYSMGWRVGVCGRSSRTITSPHYLNGGTLDDTDGVSDVDDYIDNLILERGAAKNNVICFFIGVNDIFKGTNTAAQMHTALVTFAEARKTAALANNKGVKLVACAIPELTLSGTSLTKAQDFNTLLRASNTWDAVVPLDPMTFRANRIDIDDELHPNAVNNARVGAVVANAIGKITI